MKNYDDSNVDGFGDDEIMTSDDMAEAAKFLNIVDLEYDPNEALEVAELTEEELSWD